MTKKCSAQFGNLANLAGFDREWQSLLRCFHTYIRKMDGDYKVRDMAAQEVYYDTDSEEGHEIIIGSVCMIGSRRKDGTFDYGKTGSCGMCWDGLLAEEEQAMTKIRECSITYLDTELYEDCQVFLDGL